MKKTLLRRGAVIAACAAAFVLVSCGETEFDGRQDTVYELDTPTVRAVAYPGMNLVTWEAVTGAQDYTVTAYYEDGSFKTTKTISNLYWSDSKDLENNKSYTYRVVANVGSNPSSVAQAKAVYVKSSDIGEASAEAIVPPVGTKALDLAAYEDGYDGETKTVSNDDKYVLTASNLTADVVDNNIVVTLPMKVYLKYDIISYTSNLPHKILEVDPLDDKRTDKSDETISAENNVTKQYSLPITTNTKTQFAVVAKSQNSLYAKSDEILSAKTVEVKDLGLNPETSNFNVVYVSNGNKFATGANKTVRGMFTPAKKNGTYVSPSWYKVYRRVKGEYENTEIAVTVESNSQSNDMSSDNKPDLILYYFEDSVADVTKDYVYTLVVTDNTYYGKANQYTLLALQKSDITGITIGDPDNVWDSDDPTKQKTTIGLDWKIYLSGIAAKVDSTRTVKFLVLSDRTAIMTLDNKRAEALAQEILDKGTLVTPSKVEGSNNIYSVKTSVSAANDGATVYVVVSTTASGYNTTNVVKKAVYNKMTR